MVNNGRAKSRRIPDAERQKRDALRKGRKARAKLRLGLDDFMDAQLVRVKRNLTRASTRIKQDYLRTGYELIESDFAIGHMGRKLPNLSQIERDEDNR